MKVETYEQTESVSEAETLASDSASIEIIEKCGLKGQLALINKETATVCPYRQLTTEENFVFRVLCPKQDNVDEYSGGPIPLRVLQIIAWAKEQGIFSRLAIWSAQSATVKDPVLVGIMPRNKSTWREDIFLLARWGDELLPIEVLLPDAYRKWWQERKADMQQKQAELTIALSTHIALEKNVHIPNNF